jgi:hypothetical protein
MKKQASRKRKRAETLWMAWSDENGFMPQFFASTKPVLLATISGQWLGNESNCVRVRITEVPPRKRARK